MTFGTRGTDASKKAKRDNCYMYFLDRQRNADGRRIYKVKNNFDYPLQKDRSGGYRVMSGEQLRVCMTSDFFLAEADGWRNEAWRIIKQRPDVVFFLLTKRPGAGGGLVCRPTGATAGKTFFSMLPAKIKSGRTSESRLCSNCLLNTRGLWRRLCRCGQHQGLSAGGAD